MSERICNSCKNLDNCKVWDFYFTKEADAFLEEILPSKCKDAKFPQKVKKWVPVTEKDMHPHGYILLRNDENFLEWMKEIEVDE